MRRRVLISEECIDGEHDGCMREVYGRDRDGVIRYRRKALGPCDCRCHDDPPATDDMPQAA